MGKKSHPRRGSLAFKPKKRAKRIYPSIKKLKAGNVPFGGFAGYKVGMTRLLLIDDRKNSLTEGQEIAEAVTLLETPPLKVMGVRFYGDTYVVKDVLSKDLSKNLKKKLPLPKKKKGVELPIQIKPGEEVKDIALIVHTQPEKAGIHKHKPEVFEMPLAGTLDEKVNMARERLGKEIKVSDVLKDGSYVDTISVTKGKGMEGPVKRHGVKRLSHKSQKTRRKAGNIGPWHPDWVMWQVPMAGQQGLNRRTEFNKRILKIGKDPKEINPKSGFRNYGLIKSEYIIVKGSVPGAIKRLVMLRHALRKKTFKENPVITHVLR